MSIQINVRENNIWQNKADASVIFVIEDALKESLSQDVVSLVPKAESLLADRKFTGKSKSVVILPTSAGDVKYLIFAGLGKKKNNTLKLEDYRRTLGSIARAISGFSINSINLSLPDSALFGVSVIDFAKDTATILVMADYIFDDFITEGKDKKDVTVDICSDSKSKSDIESGVNQGIIIGSSVNAARHWIDLPANMLTPTILATKAHEIANKNKLDFAVFGEESVKEMGMGGLAAVSAGSMQECRFVIMEYKTDVANAPTIAIVGKGITFDSGGLSIKPASYMETMKEDMSGAASVIATMNAISQLKPKVNVIAFAPMTENLPGSNATKPGDIITFYNGKTAEVKNTDAEGRLILADALSYAVKHYKPDVMLDAATLTGACSHALGPFFSGLFTEHDDLARKVQESADRSGDYVWRLPLTDDYKGAVKADIADLCNIGKSSYKAGGTTAACFLQHFVGETPWAHLDIAGTAFDVPDVPYYRKYSATGASIRLFIDFIMNYKK